MAQLTPEEIAEDLQDTIAKNPEYYAEPLNVGHGHEVLDRTFVNMETFNHYIQDHTFIVNNPDLFAKACQIGHLMYQLYNDIGTKTFLEEDKEKTVLDI